MSSDKILRLTPQIIAANEINNNYHKAFENLLNRTILVSIYHQDVIFKLHDVIDLIFHLEDIARFGRTVISETEYPLFSLSDDIEELCSTFTVIRGAIYITDKKKYLNILSRLRLEFQKNKNRKYINDTFKDIRGARGYLTYKAKFRSTISLKLLQEDEERDYSQNIIMEVANSSPRYSRAFYLLENPAYEVAPVLYFNLRSTKIGKSKEKFLQAIDDFLKDNATNNFDYAKVSNGFILILKEIKKWFSLDIFITKDNLIKGENYRQAFFEEIALNLKEFIINRDEFNIDDDEPFEEDNANGKILTPFSKPKKKRSRRRTNKNEEPDK